MGVALPTEPPHYASLCLTYSSVQTHPATKKRPYNAWSFLWLLLVDVLRTLNYAVDQRILARPV